MRNVCKVSFEKHERKRLLERPRRRWEKLKAVLKNRVRRCELDSSGTG
jgi:hypothetical protein